MRWLLRAANHNAHQKTSPKPKHTSLAKRGLSSWGVFQLLISIARGLRLKPDFY